MRKSTEDINRAFASINGLDEQASIGGLAVQFTEEPLGNKSSTIKHAVVKTDAETSRLIILISRLTTHEMVNILAKLKEITTGLNIPGSWAEAEASTIYAKQFDFVLFGIPTIRVDDIRNYFLKRIKQLYD